MYKYKYYVHNVHSTHPLLLNWFCWLPTSINKRVRSFLQPLCDDRKGSFLILNPALEQQ